MAVCPTPPGSLESQHGLAFRRDEWHTHTSCAKSLLFVRTWSRKKRLLQKRKTQSRVRALVHKQHTHTPLGWIMVFSHVLWNTYSLDVRSVFWSHCEIVNHWIKELSSTYCLSVCVSPWHVYDNLLENWKDGGSHTVLAHFSDSLWPLFHGADDACDIERFKKLRRLRPVVFMWTKLSSAFQTPAKWVRPHQVRVGNFHEPQAGVDVTHWETNWNSSTHQWHHLSSTLQEHGRWQRRWRTNSRQPNDWCITPWVLRQSRTYWKQATTTPRQGPCQSGAQRYPCWAPLVRRVLLAPLLVTLANKQRAKSSVQTQHLTLLRRQRNFCDEGTLIQDGFLAMRRPCTRTKTAVQTRTPRNDCLSTSTFTSYLSVSLFINLIRNIPPCFSFSLLVCSFPCLVVSFFSFSFFLLLFFIFETFFLLFYYYRK